MCNSIIIRGTVVYICNSFMFPCVYAVMCIMQIVQFVVASSLMLDPLFLLYTVSVHVNTSVWHDASNILRQLVQSEIEFYSQSCLFLTSLWPVL